MISSPRNGRPRRRASRRAVLPAGRLLHRSVAARRARGDHARAWRPRARRAAAHYLASRSLGPVLRVRLPAASHSTRLAYGETLRHDGVTVSLHPAGHVLGSAQVRIEHRGEVWVVSGDYIARRTIRTLRLPFEPVRCHTLHHGIDVRLADLSLGAAATTCSRHRRMVAGQRGATAARRVLFCYAFGKAQRILAGVDALDRADRRATARSTPLNRAYREAGVALPPRRASSPSVDDAMRFARRARASRRRRRSARHGCGASATTRDAFASRLDAAARRAAPPRRRPRLRAVRPRRLARRFNAPSTRPALSASSSRTARSTLMVRWLREQRPRRAARIRQTEYGDARSRRTRRMRPGTSQADAHEALRARCTPRSTPRRRRNAKLAALTALFPRRGRRATPRGRSYFLAGGRPRQPVPDARAARRARASGAAAALALRRVLRRGRRLRRNHRARAAAAVARSRPRARRTGSSERVLPLRGADAGAARDAIARLLGRARRAPSASC